MAVSAASVPVGTAFTLTCTAKTAAGATDTAYASQVNVTDDNTPLSLVDAVSGNAFTRFLGTDFVDGVASVSLKWSGTITSDATVIISGLQNGAVLPKGQVSQTVTTEAGASTVTVVSAVYIDKETLHPCSDTVYTILAEPETGSPADVGQRLFVKFSSPLSVLQAITGSVLSASQYFSTVAGVGGELVFRVYVDPILSDFDPLAVTWANQGGLSYGADLIGAGTLAIQSYDADLASLISARFPAVLLDSDGEAFSPPCYGLRIRCVYPYGSGGGGVTMFPLRIVALGSI
jgi:hypothetical protein